MYALIDLSGFSLLIAAPKEIGASVFGNASEDQRSEVRN
jgi:hypothetical protein